MIYKPTFDRFLVKKLDQEKSAGGLYLPQDENSPDKTIQVEILEQGPLVPYDLVGVTVLITKYAGTEIKALSGLLIINEKDILAIVR